jgi:Sec-independent protein translocase protein TatA
LTNLRLTDPALGARRTYYPRMGPDVLVLLVVILILALLWRGPKTLPKIGQALGRGVKNARDEAREVRSAFDKRDGAPPA